MPWILARRFAILLFVFVVILLYFLVIRQECPVGTRMSQFWPRPQTSHHVGVGHSSHVTHVEFFSEDDRLLSTGGRDMAVLQWAVE